MCRNSGSRRAVLLALVAAGTHPVLASEPIELRVRNSADDPITLAAASCDENHTVAADGSDLVLSLSAPTKLWVVPRTAEWECGSGCAECFFVAASEPAHGEEMRVQLGWGEESAEPADEEGEEDEEQENEEEGRSEEENDEEEETWEDSTDEEIDTDSVEEYRGYRGDSSSTPEVELTVLRWRNGTRCARLSILAPLTDAASSPNGEDGSSADNQQYPPHGCRWRCRGLPPWRRWRCMRRCRCRRICRRRCDYLSPWRRRRCLRRCWRRCHHW